MCVGGGGGSRERVGTGNWLLNGGRRDSRCRSSKQLSVADQ